MLPKHIRNLQQPTRQSERVKKKQDGSPQHGSECEYGGHAHPNSAGNGRARDEEAKPAEENEYKRRQISLKQVESGCSRQIQLQDKACCEC